MIIDKKKKNINQLYLSAPGVLEEDLDQDIIDELKLNITETFQELETSDKNKIKNSVESSIRKHIKKLINKAPLINMNIFLV